MKKKPAQMPERNHPFLFRKEWQGWPLFSEMHRTGFILPGPKRSICLLACVVLFILTGLFLHGSAALAPSSGGTTTAPNSMPVAEEVAVTSAGFTTSSEVSTTPASFVLTTSTTTPASFVLTAVGDIILHQAVIDGGLQIGKSPSTYAYDHLFEHVSTYFTASDYAIANYEGTLNGPPYSGYPMFGAPDAIATAMKTAGFDMVTTANNHAFDRKLAGLIRTPKVFRQAGIEVVGTRSTAKDPTFQVIERNGIKIGVTAYTWETIGTESNRALNGIPLPHEANALVDSFNPSHPMRYEQDKTGMKRRIKDMKAAGAESIVFLMHWGDEYKTVSNASQKKLAQYLSDNGVDVIIGHHPHVLQEISVLKSAATGKGTLVYYSLGNFLANMSFSTHGTNGNAEDAVIAQVTFERDKNGKVLVTKGEYIKTYAWKDKTGSRLIHRIIPVSAAVTTPVAFGMKSQLTTIRKSDARIDKVMGASDGTSYGIRIAESTLLPDSVPAP